MLAPVFFSISAIGLTAALFMTVSLRSTLGRRPSGGPPARPAVSILKPLCGVDADLETNLESFFRLDYPHYELIFGVQDPQDPALETAKALAARFPEIPVRTVVTTRSVGWNPKVNNLAGMLNTAGHDLILISDSNIAVHPAYLQEQVDWMFGDKRIGLVTGLFRGTGERGLGGGLEALQLNTFVAGGVAALSGPLNSVCAVGKSMLMQRSDLKAIGGFPFLAGYLAEDQVCGEAIRTLGKRVILAPQPIDNVLGRLSFKRFCARHLRWALIRRRMAPAGYAAEILLNPLGFGLLGCAVNPSPASAATAAVIAVGMSLNALVCERMLGTRRAVLETVGLELLRSLTLFMLWPVPFGTSRVTWRGHQVRVGPGTRLEPVDGAMLEEPEWPFDLNPEEA